jgi:hypothetical protein
MKVNHSVTVAAFVVLLVSVSLHSLVTAQISCGDKAILELFSSYSSSDGLRYIAHSHACREPLNHHHLIFYSSWFLEGNPRVAIQTMINEQGIAESVRSVFDWADQDARSNQLTEEQAAAVAMTIAELPESAKSPPLGFLYVVSFKNHGEWMTRIYDRRQLPAAITKLHSIVGYPVISNGGA